MNIVETIPVDHVGRESSSVSPVQAQLVCYTLFEEMKRGNHSKLINKSLYEKPRGLNPGKPGAEGILTSHLNRVLHIQLSANQRKIAFSLLQSLVTYDGYRAVKSYENLVSKKERDEKICDIILEILVENRMLRVDTDENDQTTFELAHDYLLREIQVDLLNPLKSFCS